MESRRVAVLGLGYVGLPLVRACVGVGHEVVGFDVNKEIVASLRAGHSHVDDVSDEDVSGWLENRFFPTSDVDDLTRVDVFVICVPTPLTDAGGPDLSAVIAATRTVTAALPQGSRNPLVVLESTTYPGTTDEVVRPLLEVSGLVAGRDFALAFSPERIDPGNKTFTFENTPKVVGGFSPECCETACEFYGGLVAEVVPVKGLREAEMAKLLENTYRHVNIALVNELAKLSHQMGIDIWEVIRAAETKPYGFQAFRPGPGVGGHCIPIDPNYLSHRVKAELGQPFRFVELAQEINNGMPAYVVHRVQDVLNEAGVALNGASVLVLGVTYKKDIADTRESPAFQVIHELLKHGAVVSFHDPFVDQVMSEGAVLARVPDLAVAAQASACVVLLQDHAGYAECLAALEHTTVFDTRGVLEAGRDMVAAQGEQRRWQRL